MSYNGVGLVLIALFFSGCASLQEPRWALLGDTNEQAFYLDRQQVERLPNGNYSYPVKTCLYLDGQPHQLDESRDTNKVLLVEMNCRKRQWTEAWSAFMDRSGKILFRHLNRSPSPQPIEPNTIHFSAYHYLCGDKTVVAQHNHQ
jgi:hypothetical protein